MRIGTISAMIAIPVSSFGAIWFDAAVSGYGSWPADGSPKVVEGAGSWTNTSVATYDFSRKRILVDSECDSSLDFAPLSSRSIESKQVDVTSVVRFSANTILPSLTPGGKGALSAAGSGSAVAFYGLAKDPVSGTNVWTALSGAVPDCSRDTSVKISLRMSGGTKYVRYEIDGTALSSGGNEWLETAADDESVSVIQFEGNVEIAGLFSAEQADGPVYVTVPQIPNATLSYVKTGNAVLEPQEDGRYAVPSGAFVTIGYSPDAGYVMSTRGGETSIVAMDDMEIPAGSLPVAVNVAGSIVINEVMASNGESLATRNGGAEIDWFELRNDSAYDIDLSGWFAYDDASAKKASKWVQIEGECVVPAGGCKIVWCDKTYSNWAQDEAHAAFGIGKSGGTLILADAKSVDSIRASLELPPQMKDISYGKGSIEKTVLSPLAPAQYRTPGGEWHDCEGTLGAAGAVEGFTVTSYVLDSAAAANIPAAVAAIASGAYQPKRTLSGLQTIAYTNANKSVKYSPEFAADYRHVGTLGVTGSYYAFVAEGVVYIPRAGSWTFCVGSDDGFSLEVSNEKYSFSSEFTGSHSYGQTPSIFRVREPGAYNVRLVYFQGTGSAALDFSVKEGEFDDYETFTLDGFALVGKPESGVVHAGSWAGYATTDVSEEAGAAASVEWKAQFELEEAPSPQDAFKLKVRHSGGFTAKINGTEVASVEAASKKTLEEAGVPETVEVPASLFAQGANTVEITAFNADSGDGAFLLGAEIAATASGESDVFFRESTPGRANTTAGYGPATPKVSFSVPHGWKTEPFSLELSCEAEPDAQIYYTLDGTSPTTSSTPYTGPVPVSSTTCIRAAVPREGSVIQQDASATYLFLSDILEQERGQVPRGFPAATINSQAMMYGMDAAVVDGADRDRLLEGFTNSIATMSIVIDPRHLFDSVDGIYVNALACDGRAWERPTMVEQIDPRDPSNGFSTAAGIRIRGAFSRKPQYPKHSLRLFFRNDYGDGPLEFPLFGSEGAAKFKKVDLRTSQNYAWANGYKTDTFVHEVFSRDTQRDMGDLYTRSRYYNLFINGQYWGLYQTQERGDEDFAETYNGGDADFYDVIKTSQPGYVTGASEGTIDAWEALWNMAVNEGFSGQFESNYMKAAGCNPDGTRNAAYPVYLNPTNLMDYMLCAHYVVDWDSPASGTRANNLYAVRDRNDADDGLKSQGFYFLRHDAEHSMGENTDHSKVSDDPTGYGTTIQHSNFALFENFNPAELNYKLLDNPEYRIAFADRFHMHCLAPGGALTAAKARERFESRMAEIDSAIVCESARWAAKGQTRQTWLDTCGRCLDFIDSRMPYMLAQYRNRGWYPSVAAPATADASGALLLPGTLLPGGSTVKLVDSETSAAYASPGSVYYTLDGTDPRERGGAVSQSAAQCAAEGFVLPEGGATVKARFLSSSGEWSALSTAVLEQEIPSDQSLGVRVAAVMSSTVDGGGDGSEFIILTNIIDRTVSLEGLRITAAKTGAAVKFDITLSPGREIAANGTLTLEKTADWPSLKITNGSVDMNVYGAEGESIQTLHFEAGWWSKACDGTGAHFVALEHGDSVTEVSQWRPSFVPPSSVAAKAAVAEAILADGRIRTWLDSVAMTQEGAEAIASFAGNATTLAACRLVNTLPETDPEIILQMPAFTVADDGAITLSGALSIHGAQSPAVLNGELRLYRADTLAGLADSAEYTPLGNSLPVENVKIAPEGGARPTGFFRLSIE